jgi:PAS domain S-box-containing protein
MKNPSTPSYTFPFILLGFLFGLIIVAFGTVVVVLTSGQPLTFDNLLQAQLSTPVLWVLDSVPFFMAAILGVLGSRETKLARARRDGWEAQRRVVDASRLSSEMAKKDKERQDIEEVISRGKREWEATFDSVQDLILLTDERRTVIRCNRSAAQAFYMDFPQIIGKPVDELFFGADSGEQLPAQKTEVKFPALDGWYEVTSTPLTFEGIPHGKIFVVRNITDRKQAALDLERQKQFYEALVKNSPIAIVTLSLEHRVVACNPAFETMFDYRQQEVLGQNIDSLISPLEILEESQSLTQRVERGETVYKISQRRRKDGSLIDVEAFGIPVVLWGKQIGILGMYNDISDLVRAGQVSRTEMLEEEAPVGVVEEAPEPLEEMPEEPVEEASVLRARQRLIKIETIEGVGAVYAAKLAEVGIITTEDLLTTAGTRKGRQELVEKTGISSKLVLKWVNRADLMRVPGIGEEYSDLLEAGGVDTVKELRNRKAENLHKTLVQVNDEKSLVRRSPHLSEVEAWVAAAKEIEPRVSY